MGDRAGLGDGDAGTAPAMAGSSRRHSPRDAGEVVQDAVAAALAFETSTDADPREVGRSPILQTHDSLLVVSRQTRQLTLVLLTDFRKITQQDKRKPPLFGAVA